jgi:hypothetical protein
MTFTARLFRFLRRLHRLFSAPTLSRTRVLVHAEVTDVARFVALLRYGEGRTSGGEENMALRPKFTVPKLEASSFRGWTFVLIAGTVLAIIALLTQGTGTTNETGCVMAVQGSAPLDVYRSASTQFEPVDRLDPGSRVDAQPGVIENGFRRLVGDNRWAVNERLAATEGSRC